MKLSVVVPTFNRKDMLRRCLTALAAQDYPDYEVLVVDGGKDGTDEMMACEFPRFRYLREERSGPSVARNVGVVQATGEIIVFTDDDNVVPPDWLSRYADGYRRHPEITSAAGRCEPPAEVWRQNVFARHELWTTWYAYGLTPDRAEYIGGGLDVPGATNNVSYRRAALLAVNGFSTNFKSHMAGEERELRERLCAHGYTAYLYLPLRVLHLRRYSLKDFVTQSLETGLGVRLHRRRTAVVQNPLQETERLKRGRFAGLRQAAGARDWQLVMVLLLERAIYLVGRLLPDEWTLEFVRLVSKL